MTLVKFCGITSLQDALAAIECGADYLGFNFYPPSPRSITLERCAEISTVLERDFPSVRRVGVFVNLPAAEIDRIATRCRLHLAQLHGDETPVLARLLRTPWFRAFRGIPPAEVIGEYLPQAGEVAPPKGGASPPAPKGRFAEGSPLKEGGASPLFLIDAAAKGVYGGSGETADWDGAARLAGSFALFLAGGLTPGNVAEAVGRVHPWGVDAASGIESQPGVKDPGKMKAFVQAVRAASA